jgi:hypothetical protein
MDGLSGRSGEVGKRRFPLVALCLRITIPSRLVRRTEGRSAIAPPPRRREPGDQQQQQEENGPGDEPVLLQPSRRQGLAHGGQRRRDRERLRERAGSSACHPGSGQRRCRGQCPGRIDRPSA